MVRRRLESALEDIAALSLVPVGRRVHPLVAVPVLGVGRGGHAHEPGLVVRTLVDDLDKFTSRYGLDIALVSPEPSVFAAAQFARRALPSPLPTKFEELASRLGKSARDRELALFLGAGVSIPAGLKSWNELIGELATRVDNVTPADLKGLSATDQAELIEREDRDGFQDNVAALVRPAKRPALVHALLAGLNVSQVVTTNYDLLYEDAVKASQREIRSVMPWSSALGAQRWVLKLHGDIEHPKQIVLTRRHMVMYDAANRPSAALLQSLLLTKHLLMIGASLTDDNVVRLAHEVQAYRDEHQGTAHTSFGTVLDASDSGERVRARLWSDQLEWVHLADAGVGGGPRALELLLDRMTLHATRDSSWLLDSRFSGLLENPRDREIAEQVRALVVTVQEGSPETWQPLLERLEQLGARSSPGDASSRR